ncbi:hypothetical protein RU820_06025 [Acidithiobacillus ferrooxidans]|uniref:Uncharacterized protein n=1 Tax=Acidithiobacillus ferrooxidans (strain ATCC 23270 / DSM 14882 / CIP 104768 / NCIMB 8455) TaxID=243159 RepID=B7J8U6_ACIF2|nr:MULTISPECIES: hypothetical protein [Acidithiobacillus]ACK78898.1 hypothetical protein AFE_1264 [Acidithiobacillus ferrooxidans ATCC 23270]MBN6745191.1 hypothetical protein [Acidithiobacillus sp. MC2.2]MBN6748048.1 hypothetical protein [Acidithiobacillus sp. PG05]
MAAAKLALKAGGERAGEQRQNKLIQDNTDLAAVLMAPDRIQEIVSRRTFGSSWMGSYHAYDAGLLSGREEFSAEASSRLRMAMDWLHAWARLPEEDRQDERVSDADRAELAMALLRLRSPKKAARFLRSWTWRQYSFEAGWRLGRRLIDLGQYEQLITLTAAAGNDVWLLLGLASEARSMGYLLPAAPLARLLRLLAHRRVKLPESKQWNMRWTLLYAVSATIELAARVLPPEPETWAAILRRYLPSAPPSELASRFGFDRAPLLRAYALEAALRGQKLALLDVAPPEVREQLGERERYGRSQETETFLQEVGGLLAWSVLSAEVACGRMPASLAEAVGMAVEETSSREARSYRQVNSLRQTVALEWLRILQDAGAAKGTEVDAFKSWLARQEDTLWSGTLISLCRSAARAEGFEQLAVDFATGAYQILEASRENAESRADSYLNLSRAILAVSPPEASVYFNRAVDIASRIGDENLSRWAALLHLADAAGERDNPRPRTAYRLSRVAELTYEYVARDKHFDWAGTVEALTSLCASSALAILSRWRDRRFGTFGRLLPHAIYRLAEQNQLPVITPVVFGGIEARWDRLADLRRVVAVETDPARRSVAAQVAYRYIRVQPENSETWSELRDLGSTYGIDFPDIDRLVATNRNRVPTEKNPPAPEFLLAESERRSPDWSTIFQDVDLTNSDALRWAYAAIRTYDPPYECEAFYREAFARVRIGWESTLVRAIASWPDFGIFDLRYLLDALPSPPSKQVAFRNAVRDAVLSACRREPERVHRRGWNSPIPFEKLHAEGITLDQDVVRATLEGFTRQVDTLDVSEMFHLVDPLAACLSPAEADEALNFGLDLLENVLRPEDGDGLWRPELHPPQSLISALAGYVWAGLGSPVVAERWQYAHVVRTVIELGWSELLDALIAWAESGEAGPFVDQGLQFYVWHARQWLLIGLARGGLENAAALRPVAQPLQRWLREEHVLIRDFAARALRTLVAAGELEAEEAGDLNSVNQPSLLEQVSASCLELTDDASASEQAIGDDEKYYFGIDIGPYWFQLLGRVFGLTQGAIELRARQALRQRMGWSGGGRREDARYWRKIFDDGETMHSHGDLPKTDDLCTYHGYHAMMLVAAVLLKDRPVRRHPEEPLDDFRGWLSRYLLTRTDGRWLADWRDPRLVMDPPPAGYGDKLWRWSVTPDYLDEKLVTDDGLIVLWGSWTGGDEDYRETVSICSALVSHTGAEALVAALQTAPETGRFALPRAGLQDDLEAGTLRLRGWVTDEHVSGRIDEGDPWAKGLCYPGPAPSEEAIAKAGLTTLTNGRTWDGSSYLLRREVWTRIEGLGREAQAISGSRLSGDHGFVKRLLDAYPEDRLVLTVEVRRPPRYERDKDEFELYPWPYARYYLIGDDGVAHAL